MKFILNKTSGINGIEKVSLEKIIRTFSVPKNIEINIDKSNILDIGLKYEDINLAIFYVINFISSEITKNYITVHFVIKKLYLDENIFIEENEEIKKILPKIIKYLKNNNKSTEYNIERRRKSGIYYFDNEGIAIFYQKEFNKKIVEKMCHNPAILFDIEDRGYLREGYYADLVLVDMNALWTVQKQNLLYKCGWSPLEGQQFHAKIVSTFVNGQLAYNNGQVCPTPYGQRVTFNR